MSQWEIVAGFSGVAGDNHPIQTRQDIISSAFSLAGGCPYRTPRCPASCTLEGHEGEGDVGVVVELGEEAESCGVPGSGLTVVPAVRTLPCVVPATE